MTYILLLIIKANIIDPKLKIKIRLNNANLTLKSIIK